MPRNNVPRVESKRTLHLLQTKHLSRSPETFCGCRQPQRQTQAAASDWSDTWHSWNLW